MSNPYQTPGSDVQVQEVISKTKWKFFFWLLLALEIISILLMAIDDTETIYYLVLEVVIYGVILLGIYGYAYDKKFWNQNFWKPVLPVAMIYDFYYLFIDEPWSFESAQEMYFVIIVFAVIAIPLIFLQYLALYRYAFKAEEIWK